MILKGKWRFNKLEDKRLNEITKLGEKGKFDNFIYRYKGQTPDVKFDEFDTAFKFLDKIRNDRKTLADVKNDQII